MTALKTVAMEFGKLVIQAGLSLLTPRRDDCPQTAAAGAKRRSPGRHHVGLFGFIFAFIAAIFETVFCPNTTPHHGSWNDLARETKGAFFRSTHAGLFMAGLSAFLINFLTRLGYTTTEDGSLDGPYPSAPTLASLLPWARDWEEVVHSRTQRKHRRAGPWHKSPLRELVRVASIDCAAWFVTVLYHAIAVGQAIAVTWVSSVWLLQGRFMLGLLVSIHNAAFVFRYVPVGSAVPSIAMGIAPFLPALAGLVIDSDNVSTTPDAPRVAPGTAGSGDINHAAPAIDRSRRVATAIGRHATGMPGIAMLQLAAISAMAAPEDDGMMLHLAVVLTALKASIADNESFSWHLPFWGLRLAVALHCCVSFATSIGAYWRGTIPAASWLKTVALGFMFAAHIMARLLWASSASGLKRSDSETVPLWASNMADRWLLWDMTNAVVQAVYAQPLSFVWWVARAEPPRRYRASSLLLYRFVEAGHDRDMRVRHIIAFTARRQRDTTAEEGVVRGAVKAFLARLGRDFLRFISLDARKMRTPTRIPLLRQLYSWAHDPHFPTHGFAFNRPEFPVMGELQEVSIAACLEAVAGASTKDAPSPRTAVVDRALWVAWAMCVIHNFVTPWTAALWPGPEGLTPALRTLLILNAVGVTGALVFLTLSLRYIAFVVETACVTSGVCEGESRVAAMDGAVRCIQEYYTDVAVAHAVPHEVVPQSVFLFIALPYMTPVEQPCFCGSRPYGHTELTRAVQPKHVASYDDYDDAETRAARKAEMDRHVRDEEIARTRRIEAAFNALESHVAATSPSTSPCLPPAIQSPAAPPAAVSVGSSPSAPPVAQQGRPKVSLSSVSTRTQSLATVSPQGSTPSTSPAAHATVSHPMGMSLSEYPAKGLRGPASTRSTSDPQTSICGRTASIGTCRTSDSESESGDEESDHTTDTESVESTGGLLRAARRGSDPEVKQMFCRINGRRADELQRSLLEMNFSVPFDQTPPIAINNMVRTGAGGDSEVMGRGDADIRFF